MKHPFLTSRTGSSYFYFRRKIPAALRSVMGLSEMWISLRTPHQKEALTRLPKAALLYEQRVADAAAQMPAIPTDDEWLPAGLNLPPAAAYHPTICPPGWTRLAVVQIPLLLERYRSHALASDVEWRRGMSATAQDEHQAFLEDARLQARRARAAEDLGFFRDTAEDVLEAERLWLPADSDGYTLFLEGLAATEVRVLDEELARIKGDGSRTPELRPLVDVQDSWDTALTRWIAERAPQKKTIDEVKTQVARFKRLVGDLPLSALTPDHVEAFKTACIEAESLSLSRINTIVSLLSPLLNVAIQKRLVALSVNPFTRAKISQKAVRKNRKTVRDAFTIAELNRLYTSRVFSNGHRPAKGGGEAAYWLPLLAPLTGARVEDLCRLTVADIVQRDGHWCMHLHDTKRAHRLGIPATMRYVPMHVLIQRCGFLAYVHERSAEGSNALLFPHLRLNQYGQRSAVFSNWFGEYLNVDANLPDPRLTFHSLRHTFQAFAEESGISGHVIDELVGHTADSRYGRKEDGEKRLPFGLLVTAIQGLAFPGLELDHLFTTNGAV